MPPRLLLLALAVLACGSGPQAAPVPSVGSHQDVGVAGNARVSTATGGDVTQSVTTRRTLVPHGGVAQHGGYVPRPRKRASRPKQSEKVKGYHPRPRGNAEQQSRPLEVHKGGQKQTGKNGQKRLKLVKRQKYTPPASHGSYYPQPTSQASSYQQPSPAASYGTSNVQEGSVVGYAPQSGASDINSRQGVDVTGNAKVAAASAGAVSQTVATKRTVIPLAKPGSGVYGATSGTGAYPAGGGGASKGSYQPTPTSQAPSDSKPAVAPDHLPSSTRVPYDPKKARKGAYYPESTTTPAPYYQKPTQKEPSNPQPATSAPDYLTPAPKVLYTSPPTTRKPYYARNAPRTSVSASQNASPNIVIAQSAEVAGNAQVSATSVGTISQTATKRTVTPLDNSSNGVSGATSGNTYVSEKKSTEAVKRTTVASNTGNNGVTTTQKAGTGSFGMAGPKFKPVPMPNTKSVPVPKFTPVPMPPVRPVSVPSPRVVPVPKFRPVSVPPSRVVPVPKFRPVPVPSPRVVPVPKFRPVPVPPSRVVPVPKYRPVPVALTAMPSSGAPPPYREVVRRADNHAKRVRRTLSEMERARIADELPVDSTTPDGSETRPAPQEPYYPSPTEKTAESQNPTRKVPYYPSTTSSAQPTRKTPYYSGPTPMPSPVTKVPYYPRSTTQAPYYAKTARKGSYYPKPDPVPSRKKTTVVVREQHGNKSGVTTDKNGMEQRFQAAKRRLERSQTTKACSGSFC